MHQAAPLAVDVRRREPAPTPVLAGPYRNLRPVLSYAPQLAPRDPRERPAPVRASRMPVFMYTAIRAYKAVSGQDNYVKLWAPNLHPAQPQGTMVPFRQNANIRNPRPDAFGSQFDLDPDNATGALAVTHAGMP